MKKKIPLELEALLNLFPVIDPPITLSEEIAYKFSAENRPISQKLIETYFANWDTLDEYSELVPCCQLKSEGPYFSIIYWKGSLLTYEYILANVDETGLLISKKVIAGTVSNGISVKSSVASIDESGIIYSMAGESKDPQNYDPAHSNGYSFEILPDGQIISSKV